MKLIVTEEVLDWPEKIGQPITDSDTLASAIGYCALPVDIWKGVGDHE